MRNQSFYFYMPIKFLQSKLYDEYWKFAAKRQDIFVQRNVLCKNAPWTNDSILLKYKFTNAYRVNDRVSQFLLHDIIYNNEWKCSEENLIFRILLFKIFNKISTWNAIKNAIGDIRLYKGVFTDIENVLNQLYNDNKKIYSGAYIMPSGCRNFGYHKKFLNHLALLKLMFHDNLVIKISKCKTLKELYELLLSYPTIGEFLAFQYAIDINYSDLTDFDEMEFVVPGPGAKSGIQKCFCNIEKKNFADIIKYVAYNQEKEFKRLDLNFVPLRGRPLQLIDCQNLFCEFDKYSRVKFPNKEGISGRKRIKQLFIENKNKIEFIYPPKWNLRDFW